MCETGRLFTCNRCHRQVVICASCDRGHQYCSRACSEQSRAENRREARRRYARTGKGARDRPGPPAALPDTPGGPGACGVGPAPEMADIAPVDIAPVETVSSAAGGTDDEETVTDHTSGLPRRRLSACVSGAIPARIAGCAVSDAGGFAPMWWCTTPERGIRGR